MDDRIYRVFGSRLRELREKASVTQEELARRVDFSRTSITNIEKGRQRVLFHQFVNMADALNVEPTALMPAPGDAEAPLRSDVAKVIDLLKSEAADQP